MKKFIMGVIVGAFLTVSGAVFAEDGLEQISAYLRPDLPVELDGQEVTLEKSPIVYEASTYLNLRDLAKVLPVNVAWNSETRTVVLTSDTTTTTTEQMTLQSTTEEGGSMSTTETDPMVQKQIDMFGHEITSVDGIKTKIKDVEMHIWALGGEIKDHESQDPIRNPERYEEAKQLLKEYNKKLAFLKELLEYRQAEQAN